MTPKAHSPNNLLGLPFNWREHGALHFHPDENVSACLEVDLDENLIFIRTLLILTDQRVISVDQLQKNCRSWPNDNSQTLVISDHAGVGTLSLHSDGLRLAAWRFTLGRLAAVLRFKTEFEKQRKSRLSDDTLDNSGQGASHDAVCPVCQSLIEAPEDDCPVCAEKEGSPTSTLTLFKLWRFARPYQGQLLLGFVLTLAATAATLVPPYLTMPLMDEVLIPYQNGANIDPVTVSWYLLGLFGSAFVAWGLGWIKTYILSLVSERIGADLRTTTYEHLMKLSLEYFGGRRTGDLIARIGSETDRINVFLSLHLLDFATDVLMIVMTAVILLTINPGLALVTLLPLPFIAWLIHVVRERLRTGFEKIDRVWSEVTNVLADTIPGIRVVKAFAQEKREAQRFDDANKHNLAVNDRLNRVWSLFGPTVTFMTEILNLIDSSMIINLLVVVFIGGYCTFVSKIGFENSEDKPEWLSKINANSLKVKLIVALVSITGVHLLKTFISLNAFAKADEGIQKQVIFQIVIHMIFVLSAILLAYADKISHGNKIKEVYGIFKAYVTRVGSGPFPTELFDEDGATMARVGNEFGSVTGRQRRCGWLDLVALKYAIQVNGVTQLMMMKGDVLSGFETLKVCTEYEYKGQKIGHLPYNIEPENVTPIYK